MKKVSIVSFALAASLGAGCSADFDGKPDQSDKKGGIGGKVDAYDPNSDNPATFANDLNHKLAELPMVGEASMIPWTGSYWPTYEDNINYRWDGPDSESPAAKYGRAFNVTNLEDKVSKEYGIDRYKGQRTACTDDSACDDKIGEACAKRTGETDGVCIPTWWGICHAWAPVSLSVPEPKHPVTMNGVEFKVQDIKALLTLSWNRTNSRFVSTRCNKNGNDLTKDAYGGYREDPECDNTNPATWHIIATNYLGLRGESFVYDRTFDDQVWNQPLRGYEITQQDEIDAKTANEMTGVKNEDGSIPEQYGHNTDAVSFYHVKMQVGYISEASTSTDGNLSAVIDRYTHYDRYEYILELDGDGIIIGGVWVGDSIDTHPDFLWLPTGARDQTVAGGAISRAQIMTLVEKSLNDPSEPSNPGRPVTVNESGTVAKDMWTHYGPFKADGDFKATLTGDNDADLYVRKNAQPTRSAYDCRPYRDGSDETCTIAGGGTFYVSINGYAASSAFELQIDYVEGDGGSDEPESPVDELQHINESGSVAKGEAKFYEMRVNAGQRVFVRSQSTRDVDLYLQMNKKPTTSEYLDRAWTTSGNETLDYTPTSNGTLYIMVHGYEAADYSVRTANN